MKLENENSLFLDAKVYARLSEHFEQLAAQVFGLEEIVGEIFTQKNFAPATVSKLQSIDYVRQSLEDCAILFHCLNTMNEDASFSDETLRRITDKLKLNTTKELIWPANNSEAKVTSTTGHVDLF